MTRNILRYDHFIGTSSTRYIKQQGLSESQTSLERYTGMRQPTKYNTVRSNNEQVANDDYP
jgi:hypothetical protein